MPGAIFRSTTQTGRFEVVPDAPDPVGWPLALNLSAGPAKILKSKAMDVWLADERPLSCDWVYNGCLSADAFSTALGALEDYQNESGRAVFNEPVAVLATRRDRLSDVLGGIDGLVVPHSRRYDGDVEAAVSDLEGRPFSGKIVQITSMSAPRLRLSIQPGDSEACNSIRQYPLGGNPFYMTGFDSDWALSGPCFRLAVGRGSAAICLCWNLAESDPATCHESVTPDWPALNRIASKVQSRLGLDFFGLDLKPIEDGRFVLLDVGADLATMVPPVGIDAEGKYGMKHSHGADEVFEKAFADFLIRARSKKVTK